eukprot:scaffold64535_cov20-Cyclotella_meneghiniana.AAC.2
MKNEILASSTGFDSISVANYWLQLPSQQLGKLPLPFVRTLCVEEKVQVSGVSHDRDGHTR